MKAESRDFPWKMTAVMLVGVFLLGFGGQVAIAYLDREGLETVLQPSAVEDSSYFPVPDPLAMDMPLVTFEGQSLVAAAVGDEKAKSDSMIRVGPEDSDKYDLYRSDDESDESLQGVYFLKTAPRRFLRVRVAEEPASE